MNLWCTGVHLYCIMTISTHIVWFNACLACECRGISGARNIAADHWSFSNQFQHLADQNPFSMGQQSKAYKMSNLKKTANQILILIPTTGLEQLYAACVIGMNFGYSSSDRLLLLNKAVRVNIV